MNWERSLPSVCKARYCARLLRHCTITRSAIWFELSDWGATSPHLTRKLTQNTRPFLACAGRVLGMRLYCCLQAKNLEWACMHGAKATTPYIYLTSFYVVVLSGLPPRYIAVIEGLGMKLRWYSLLQLKFVASAEVCCLRRNSSPEIYSLPQLKFVASKLTLLCIASFDTNSTPCIAQAQPWVGTSHADVHASHYKRGGGNEWLMYEMVFRQNHERKSDPWNYINPFLYTAYTGSQGLPPLTPCHHWNEVDEDCPNPSPPLSRNQTDHSSSGVENSLFLGCSRSTSEEGLYFMERSFPRTCSYHHICVSCQAGHPTKGCPLTPIDSAFKPLSK